MLDLLVVKQLGEVEDPVLRLTVKNVGGGRTCSYSARLLSTTNDESELANYPRWCEPAGALCARMLAKTLRASPRVGRNLDVSEFAIVVRIIPHGRGSEAKIIDQYAVVLRNNVFFVTSGSAVWTVERDPGAGAARNVLEILKQIFWSRKRIPRPKPLKLKVYKSGRDRYIRMGEIPEPAQSAFRRNMAGSGRPHLADAPDAAFDYDWTDFLASAR